MGRARKKLKKAPSRSKIVKLSKRMTLNLEIIRQIEQDLSQNQKSE
jgi:hypothetical protein